jgi:hypothetical protein
MSDYPDIDLASTKAIEKVNAIAAAGTAIGTDQLAIVVDEVYGVCEIIEQKNAGQSISFLDILKKLLPILSSVAAVLVPPGTVSSIIQSIVAILGGGGTLDFTALEAQAMDLTDDEVLGLANRATNFKLGVNAPKYTFAVKFLLFGVQGYSIFKPVA